ncbi:hypothetical protein Phi19:3_gp102 [Cellulophaga phage phi19:3]|uniref:Uncharacterized protein n=1 Tax=Cellulophaga phage phi19:3 TaxID=1327971 RepID=R9ZWM1_9CAUD|nr:hypothetical protein Phi19:3_gp102 [Cellulophaga phage phi19:3]AGO47506.1 hypothetical protein Phi19:3_gp102 [Cellulophaga phage phi19:3]
MSTEKELSKYYKENIPDLILDLKVAVRNNRSVITQSVDSDLSEDKYVNVLKARRMAADDTIHFLKEIDRLENELNEVEEVGVSTKKKITNPAKKYASKE